jgi:four helix bundle protein
MTISSYRDLQVWQEAMNLAEMAYTLAAGLPKDERYGLASQIKRSAISVAANIAEGYGRDSNSSYIQQLRVAQGSLKELETHVLIAERVKLIAGDKVPELLALADRVGKNAARAH